MMVKPVVMEEVHGIIESCRHVEGRRHEVVCVWLKGPYIDLGCTKVMKNTDKALDRIILFIQGLAF